MPFDQLGEVGDDQPVLRPSTMLHLLSLLQKHVHASLHPRGADRFGRGRASASPEEAAVADVTPVALVESMAVPALQACKPHIETIVESMGGVRGVCVVTLR